MTMGTTSNEESDRAKENRLREKLKRKAEERKSSKDETATAAVVSDGGGVKREDKKSDTNGRNMPRGGANNPKARANNNDGRSKSSSPPPSSDIPSNRRRNRSNNHRGGGGGPSGRYNRPSGRPSFHNNHDPYWRRDGPPHHYQEYDNNHGGFGGGYDNGWRNGVGAGYDNYDRQGPWREDHRYGIGHGHGYGHGPAYGYGDRHGPPSYRHDWERNDGYDNYGRSGPMTSNGGGVSGSGGGGGSRDGPRKERGRTRSRSFSRSRSRSRSYSRSYSRSVSRSNSVSSRSRSRSLSSDRSHERSVSSERKRSGSRSRHTKRSRSGSHQSDGKTNVKRSRSLSSDDGDSTSESPSDPHTKDQRTVFVSQLVMKTMEKDIKGFFKNVAGCKVNDVQILRDKRSGRSKGCAYVELGKLEDVPRALASSGSTPDFQRFPILVKATEADKMNWAAGGGITAPSGMPKRVEAQKVYVGSVDRNVTQAQLYAIFSQFGTLDKVTLQVDTSGMSKGFAFLSFKDPKVAYLAIQAMSGQVLAGRQLRTGWAKMNTAIPNLEEVSSNEFPDDAVVRIGKVNEALKKINSTGLALLPSLSLIPGMSQMNRDFLLQGLNGPTSSSSVTNAAEAAINAALSGLSAPVASATDTEASQEPKDMQNPSAANEQNDDPKAILGTPSKNILVRNMFDKDEETDDGWEEDIKLDFEEESSKHGKIMCVKVMSEEVGGKIFASFETVEGAKACAQNLAGRWFDKRQLRVEFVSDETFGSL